MKEPGYSSTILKIEGMHCASCQRPIEKALSETEGVADVSVNLASREVTVESYISNDELVSVVAGAGFEAVIDQIQSLEDSTSPRNFSSLSRKAESRPSTCSSMLLNAFANSPNSSSLTFSARTE